MKQKEVLFILSNGRVAAISKKDGAIIWEIKLKQYGMGAVANGIGQIMAENNRLYIGCAGKLVCLDTKDGSLVWMNELKGWGYAFVSMANVKNEAAGAAIQAAATTAAMVVAT